MNTANQWPKGIKKTRQRQELLVVLENAEQPLTAAEIAFRLQQQGEKVSLSTVYRTLDRFAEAGMLEKNWLPDEDSALYLIRRAGHVHFAICLGCHQLLPLAHCPLEAMSEKLSPFVVTGHRIELYGYCEACQNASIQQ